MSVSEFSKRGDPERPQNVLKKGGVKKNTKKITQNEGPIVHMLKMEINE